MEFGRSLCVLQSQEPPFSDDDECPSRALQLGSGKIGSNGSEATFDSLKAELIDQYSLAEVPSIFSTRTTNLDHSLSRLGERRRRRQRRDGSRQYPWQRDRNFVRYELNSERYRAYRLKSRQNSDQVWPDDVEDCLQYALRVIPALGRKKEARTDYNNQQGGRNELIRDFIMKWTGQDRGRKQVSSHLQVLKGYLSDNKEWMDLVTAGPRCSAESSRRKEYEAHASLPQAELSYLSKAGRRSYAQMSDCKALSPPARILGSNAPPFIHRVDFEMFLNDREEKRLHTFTSIQSEIGSALRPLEEVFGWERLYPHLAAYYRQQGRIESELILLETNIDMIRDHPPSESTLGINPFVVIAGGVNFRDWRSTTRLYEKGDWVRDSRRGIELDKHALKLDAENIEKSNDTKLVLQIKSKWWAYNVIAEILARITTARAQGDPSAVYQAEQWGRQFLAEMSMMQEISAIPRNGEPPQTVAILLWKFRQTRPSETATTTWRKLTPPCPQLDHDTSHILALTLRQPLAALDSMPEDDLEWQSTAYGDDGYLSQPSFFVDDPESIITGQPSEANSSSSTPTPDLQSLPSSTATSFASLGSGSFDQVDHSTRFSFAYDDSNYLSHELNNTHSQKSVYGGSMYQTQDTDYERQDIEYLDQVCSYPDPSEAYSVRHHETNGFLRNSDLPFDEGAATVHLMTRQYSDQTPYSDNGDHHPHNVAELLSRQHSNEPPDVLSPVYSTVQDFTGGQIQISFAEHEHQQQVYDRSLVALEAEILSQHHSFQEGPEAYDHPVVESEATMLSRHQSFQGETANLHEDPQVNDALQLGRRRSQFTENFDETNEADAMDHIYEHSDTHNDQSFAIDETIHRPQPSELILHHPQPHQSLQHHLESAQWQTAALWANMHNPIENDSDDMSPSFDPEIMHPDMLPEVPEMMIPELQEPGHVIGEISPAGERDEFERDMAREIRRDLSGVELGE